VAMVEAAGHGRLDDLAFVKALHPSWLRGVLRQGEVGPGTVVGEEVGTQRARMCFVQHDQVSSAGELHPRALPEPYVSLSAHTAPINQPSASPRGIRLCPVPPAPPVASWPASGAGWTGPS